MKHIRITQAGWAGYTGLFCDMNFVDGVSEELASQRMIDRCAALLQVEQVEIAEGEAEVVTPVGAGARAGGNLRTEAVVAEPLARSDDEPVTPVPAPKAAELRIYTSEELQAIADDKGIKGLRDIGDKLSVKGRAIPEIMREIMEAQNKIVEARAVDADIAATEISGETESV